MRRTTVPRAGRVDARLLRGGVLAALVALLAATAGPALQASAASGPSARASVGTAAGADINDKINAAQDDLAAANAAVAKAAQALAAARTQLPAAQAALKAANADLVAAQRTEAAAAAAAEQATAAYLAAQQRVTDAQARIADMNGQIGDLARNVYVQGPYAELAAILSAQTPSDFADQLEAVRSVSRSQNKALADLQAAKAELALASAQAETALSRAEQKRQAAKDALDSAAASARKAKAAKAKVDALIAARASAVAVAAREKAKVKAQYDELKKEQARIREAARRAAQGGGGRFTGVPSSNLIWPIPGATTSGQIGWRVHPVYGYRSCHTGIDLSGGPGTPIESAAAGRVIYAANEGAYGLHIIIDHGNSLSTMYAHMSAVAVGTGAVVRQGQVIGYVGTTGFSTGPHLHFEVHVDGIPYNPLGWFGGPREVIACWNQI